MPKRTFQPNKRKRSKKVEPPCCRAVEQRGASVFQWRRVSATNLPRNGARAVVITNITNCRYCQQSLQNCAGL